MMSSFVTEAPKKQLHQVFWTNLFLFYHGIFQEKKGVGTLFIMTPSRIPSMRMRLSSPEITGWCLARRHPFWWLYNNSEREFLSSFFRPKESDCFRHDRELSKQYLLKKLGHLFSKQPSRLEKTKGKCFWAYSTFFLLSKSYDYKTLQYEREIIYNLILFCGSIYHAWYKNTISMHRLREPIYCL